MLATVKKPPHNRIQTNALWNFSNPVSPFLNTKDGAPGDA